jgi:hypothetical protein
VAEFVHECMEYRTDLRSVRIVSLTLICHCLERIGQQGQVYDTFSSDLRGVIYFYY